MSLLKDKVFVYVILFGLFLYIGAKLLPYRETLFPIMSIGNILLMSILTIALVVSSINFPKYTIIKHCSFMCIILNFIFFLVATLAFSDLGGYFADLDGVYYNFLRINIYASGIQTVIAIACILYIIVLNKSRNRRNVIR